MLPELRKDPLSGRWVIVAPGRAARPQDVDAAGSGTHATDRCPFCPGGEAGTPNEVYAVREPGRPANDPSWRVRVVPNKYPALENAPGERFEIPAINLPPPHSSAEHIQPGRGVHEVIIESPRHLHSNTEQTADELCEVLRVYRERLGFLSFERHWRYAVIFKNVGFAAGASLEHLHSQLVALPIVPAAVEETLHATANFYQQHGQCYYCDLLRRELSDGTRIIAETNGFIALCPFAGRFAYEMWIIPKRHAAHFGAVLDSELPGLAEMLLSVLRKLEAALDKPAYNFAIRTAPFDRQADEHYHWHVEIFPRITRLAGFELSTDFYINVVRPEDAAARLRQA